jgi:hypothetical protein
LQLVANVERIVHADIDLIFPLRSGPLAEVKEEVSECLDRTNRDGETA